MKNGKIVKILLILLILLTLTFSITPVMAQDEVEQSGPWADELFFKIYLNPEAEYLALKTGDINIMDWDLRYFLYYGLLPDGKGYQSSVAKASTA